MSQTDSVAWMLRRGWVCGTEFLDARIPRYSARMADLRFRGYTFDRRKCTRHRHLTVQYEWRLGSSFSVEGQGTWNE